MPSIREVIQAQQDAGRAMLAALEIAAPRLPCPDHAGDIDPAQAKRGIASIRPYAQNTCGCERHQTLRTVWVAIAQAKAAGITAAPVVAQPREPREQQPPSIVGGAGWDTDSEAAPARDCWDGIVAR